MIPTSATGLLRPPWRHNRLRWMYQVDISNTCPDQYYRTDDGCDPNRGAGNTYTSGSTGCFSNKNDGKCEDTNFCTQNVCSANSGSDGNGCSFPDESWRVTTDSPYKRLV